MAAVGAATQLLNMVQIFYTLVATGVAIIINQNLGAGNRRYSGEVATVALALCAGLSILMGAAISIFALPLMGMMQLTGEVLVLAADYFRIVTALAITQALITLFSFIVRCYGRTQIAMVVALVMNVINALLCLLVVYRPLETPLQGVAGIGWGADYQRGGGPWHHDHRHPPGKGGLYLKGAAPAAGEDDPPDLCGEHPARGSQPLLRGEPGGLYCHQ